MKNGIFLIALSLLFSCSGKEQKISDSSKSKIDTAIQKPIFSGKYENDYGGVGSGQINIWKLEDSTAIFNIDLFNGKNLGGLVGKMNIKNNVGIFEANSQIDSCFCECVLRFDFTPKSVEVTSINPDCGFGFGVYGDGVYKKVGKDIPEYFLENGTGDTVYFSKIKNLMQKR